MHLCFVTSSSEQLKGVGGHTTMSRTLGLNHCVHILLAVATSLQSGLHLCVKNKCFLFKNDSLLGYFAEMTIYEANTETDTLNIVYLVKSNNLMG